MFVNSCFVFLSSGQLRSFDDLREPTTRTTTSSLTTANIFATIREPKTAVENFRGPNCASRVGQLSTPGRRDVAHYLVHSTCSNDSPIKERPRCRQPTPHHSTRSGAVERGRPATRIDPAVPLPAVLDLVHAAALLGVGTHDRLPARPRRPVADPCSAARTAHQNPHPTAPRLARGPRPRYRLTASLGLSEGGRSGLLGFAGLRQVQTRAALELLAGTRQRRRPRLRRGGPAGTKTGASGPHYFDRDDCHRYPLLVMWGSTDRN